MTQSDKKDMLQRILNDDPLTPPADEQLRRTLTRHYMRKRLRTLFLTTAYVLLGVLLAASGFALLNAAHDTRSQIIGAILVIAGLETTMLIKLWYWVFGNRLTILQEIKQLQLKILLEPEEDEDQEQSPLSEESLKDSWLDHISYEQAAKWSRWAIIIGAFLLMFLGSTSGRLMR